MDACRAIDIQFLQVPGGNIENVNMSACPETPDITNALTQLDEGITEMNQP